MGFNGAVCVNFSTVNPYAQEDFMLITVTDDWSDAHNAWADIKAGSDFEDPESFNGDTNYYYRTFVISPVGEDGKTRMSAMLFVLNMNGDAQPTWTPPEEWFWHNGFIGDEYPQSGDTVQVYQSLAYKLIVVSEGPG